ncbi:glycogen debranching enzyme [Macroventuria anomochaeta]|uniref:Glycogen debranching enzyme n=1 Tax=Macroventuria anomochaeta TaxID=301207 RepID=A0ACB6S387_9PLEO|nr:glycogen debranching enzyme [Macroventuria anomochaeta]KAF2628120.1 glycogen debranching enzyme [Macroventuria anomochaeta]
MLRPSRFLAALFAAVSVAQDTCNEPASRLYLPDPPYDNYIYFDCHSSSHVILTSPMSNSNFSILGPRLLMAWPAGNSGLAAYFEPTDGVNGTLTPRLENSTSTGEILNPIYEPIEGSDPRVGVSGSVNFNVPANLTIPILGSIRTIRDFAEGSSILDPGVQGGLRFSQSDDNGATVNRTWFDNITTTVLTFTPFDGAQPVIIDSNSNHLLFGAGTYRFNASFNYPHLEQLNQTEALNPQSADLIQQQPDQTTSLSFLSYEDKLLAGTWRFLTYFGRDSMISMLLMQPVLSEGENGAIEAVISAVLERINRADGTVCHEEVIGDYATYLNLKENITSTEPRCDYKMVDTDYLLPIAMQNYFVDTSTGQQRSDEFFNTTATFLVENDGLTYGTLAEITISKIMNATSAFASPGGQTIQNLIHLRASEPVGEWRDSNNGLGGGRIPYDVNAALVPAGLRAIAALSRAGFFANRPEWNETADRYAQVWEDSTLQFFEVVVPQSEAVSLVESYVADGSLSVPTNTDNITGDMTYYGVALDGNVPPPSNASSPVVPVMNTDDCFRHFFLNTTNQAQLSAFLNQTADHILNPFPVGLASDVGLFVANPAYAGNASFAANFSRGAYHGTVVWGWQLAMMGAGLGRQLGRCSSSNVPDFCNDTPLYNKVLSSYNRLWDLVENNEAQLSSEVWSWNYDNGYQATPLGSIIATESNIRQLWSLTFLAVRREKFGGSG